MEEKDKKSQEFNLEDILREFGGQPEEVTVETPEPEAEPVSEPAPIIPVEHAQPEGMGDTQVLPRIPADTIRMDPVKQEPPAQTSSEQTQRFDPVTPVRPEQPQKPEPFSKEWEP